MSNILPGSSIERASDVGSAAHRHSSSFWRSMGLPGQSVRHRTAARLPAHAETITRPASPEQEPLLATPRQHGMWARRLDGPAPQRGLWPTAIRHTAVALWALVAAAPSLFVWALPVIALVNLPVLTKATLVFAASVGVWAATQLGTALAVWLTRQVSRPPQASLELQQAMASDVQATAHQRRRPVIPTTTMDVLLRQSYQLNCRPSPRGQPDAGDWRPHVLGLAGSLGQRHTQMRVALPAAPHARNRPVPNTTVNRVDIVQKLQSDGSAFNTIGITGNPQSSAVYVATILDGYAVLTVDQQHMWRGGELLAGLFTGGWNGVNMVGCEAGYTHGFAGWGARVNGSATRSQRQTENLQLISLSTRAANRSMGLLPPPGGIGLASTPASHEASGTSLSSLCTKNGHNQMVLHGTCDTDGVANVCNLAASYSWLQAFFRHDVNRQVHSESDKIIGVEQAALVHARRRRNWRQFFAGFFDRSRLHAPEATPLIRIEALLAEPQLRRVERAYERNTGALWAMGQNAPFFTSAGTFMGRHHLELGARSLTLLPDDGDETDGHAGTPPQTVQVRYAERSHHSQRWLLALAGGMGCGQGDGDLSELELTFSVDATAQNALDRLHTAMLKAYHEDEETAQDAHAVRAALDALRAQSIGPQQLCRHKGLHWGRDVGCYAALFGSEWWEQQMPAGWARSLLRQQRTLRLQEERGDAPAGSVRPLEQLFAQKTFWAGRIIEQVGAGPLGSFEHSVWASIGVDAERKRPYVLFEANWEMTRGDAFDVQTYILQPLQEAFGVFFTAPFGSTWQTQRSVRLRRRIQADEDDPIRPALFAQAGQALLGERLAALFAATPPSAASAQRVMPLLQQAFAKAFDAWGKQSVARMAQALGAGAQAFAGRITPSVDDERFVASPLTDAEERCLQTLSRWEVTSMSQALSEPAGLLGTLELERVLHPQQATAQSEQARGAALRIDPLMALVFSDPLLSNQTRQAQLRDLRERQQQLRAF